MGAAKTLLSAEEFDNYPFEEDKRYELDEGELIEMTRPAYIHNRVMGILFVALSNYFAKNPIGEALPSENLYALSRSVRRSPDLAVILGDHSKELWEAKVIRIVPDIAVEILSPSETPAMVHRKMAQYFKAGVKEVWLVHLKIAQVEIWSGRVLPDQALQIGDALTSKLLPDFALPLADLFS